jgi:hypothetical protein
MTEKTEVEALRARLRRHAKHNGHSSDWWVDCCRDMHAAADALASCRSNPHQGADAMTVDEKALQAAIPIGSNIADAHLVRAIIAAYEAAKGAKVVCEHDWRIWPETDGQEQKAHKDA